VSLYEVVRPALFALPPETAHDLGKRAMRVAQASRTARRLVRDRYRVSDPRLRVERFGRSFPNPVGVAAGFDKNGEVTRALADLGFGFVEVGTVTPRPQAGNPRPRLFRLRADEGMVNRLGFNGQGAERVRERAEREGFARDVPVGLNVGKMNDSDAETALSDYREVYERLSPFADYAVVNVSCPNTPDAFDESSPEHLRAVFETLAAVRSGDDRDGPLLVKVGPDATRDGLAALVEVVEAHDVDGIVATNTSARRPGSLESPAAAERGGLSGRPLEARATATVRTLAELTDLPIVGVGGVRDAADAYRKLRAGACLVQLYTGFVYGGPSTARRINEGLLRLLDRDGFDSVEAAVGVDAGRPVATD
jgi:dihydroorotate dehydrogenase